MGLRLPWVSVFIVGLALLLSSCGEDATILGKSGALIKGSVAVEGTEDAAGVTVKLDGRTVSEGITEADGQFEFVVLFGTYTVSASLAGYEAVSEEVSEGEDGSPGAESEARRRDGPGA